MSKVSKTVTNCLKSILIGGGRIAGFETLHTDFGTSS